jgi:hypothetical protein
MIHSRRAPEAAAPRARFRLNPLEISDLLSTRRGHVLRLLCTVAIPCALLLLGRSMAGRRVTVPPLPAQMALGLLAPPTLVAWAGRSAIEQLLASILAAVGWGGLLLRHDGEVLAATGLIGLAWGFLLGLADQIRRDRKTVLEPLAGSTVAPPTPVARRKSTQDEAAEMGDMAFRIALPCPTCGAALPLPVYHRMALCGYCSSELILPGNSDVITAVVPDAVSSRELLVAAVVKHFRRSEYIRLFEQRVRPLIESQQRAQAEGKQPSFVLPDNSPVVVAMEAQVSHQADVFAQRVAERLEVAAWERFLAPYWHRFGTLYQAAFGRDAEAVKRMELVVTTLEGSAPATTIPLPPMGKLSYLRALSPLHGSPEAVLPALPVELGREEIDNKVQQPTRRSADAEIQVITHASTFVTEVSALIYRPWHVAEVTLDGRDYRFLVDGAAADVAGEPQWVGNLQPAPLPPGDESRRLRLVPSRCPECGADLPFAPDTVIHLCLNCCRVVELEGTRWRALPYYSEQPSPGAWMVPFWRFPVMVRSTTGALVTDLAHLTDGIDGTLDQIGDRPMGQEHFLVPAFRTRVGKVGVRLYRRLWPLTRTERTLRVQRFDLTAPPADVLPVTLPAEEARVFARVYLALAFSPRDLARADIKRVRAAFLEAELEGVPELAFINVPAAVIAPNLALFGRARPGVVSALEGNG